MYVWYSGVANSMQNGTAQSLEGIEVALTSDDYILESARD